jgi:hypothetical protein
VIQEAKQTFGPGQWWTADGKPAVVDAMVDGLLVGRIDIARCDATRPHWYAAMWSIDGQYRHGCDADNLRTSRGVKIKRTFWLNVYQDGPGLLRNTWEESLIEASREEKQPLCRVEVKVDSFVGDGLK